MFGRKSGKTNAKGKRPQKTKALTLDIGSHFIKGVLGGMDGEKVYVEKVFSEELMRDVYENGVILNKELFQKSLKHLIDTNMTKRDMDVIITIDTSELIKREIALPKVEDSEIKEMIRYEIGNYLPIDIDHYILQHRVIGTTTDINGNEVMNVLVGALPIEISKDLFDSVSELNMKPIALEIHSNTLERLFNKKYFYELDNEESVVVIDMGNNLTNIVIIEQGKYQFNRIMKFGGQNVDELIHMNYSPTDGEIRQKLKTKSIMDYQDNSPEENFSDEDFVMNNICSQFIQWIADIEKVISYYKSREGNPKINSVYLYGGNSHYKDLELLFKKYLGLETKVIDRIERISFPSKDADNTNNYINGISSLIIR